MSLHSSWESISSPSKSQVLMRNLILLFMLYILDLIFFSLWFHTNTHLYITGFMSLSTWIIILNTSCFINEFSSIKIAYSISINHFSVSILPYFIIHDPHNFLWCQMLLEKKKKSSINNKIISIQIFSIYNLL